MYKKSKKIDKKYMIIIVLVLFTFFVGISINIVKTDRNLTFPEKIIKDSILFVNKVINMPIDFIGNKFNEIKNKNNLYEKYIELKKQEEKINSINSLNDELSKEIKELKKLLELNTNLSEYTYLNASVINRNLDFFSNTLTIDKGENNKIEKGMAVVTNEGLIGKISSTSNFTSTIKLLTSDDINNKISVKIKNNDQYIYGLLTGYSDGYLIVEGIDNNISSIEKNSVVTTTGLGGVFPSGIIVGKVIDSKKDNFDLATTLLVKSDVNFNDINYVTILKRPES